MIDDHVEVKVGDETYFLQPTLKSMQAINRRHGSMVDAVRAVRMIDFDSICHVIEAGADLSKQQSIKMQHEVLQAGVMDVSAGCAEFLTALMNPNGTEEESGKE